MPPAGGYETVRYKRNLPFRGPGGAVILLGVTAVSAFGFWRVGLGNLEKRCETLGQCPEEKLDLFFYLQRTQKRSLVVKDLSYAHATSGRRP